MTEPWLDDGDVRIYVGDALETLAQLPDESVDCVVTSPPYWGLRDYGTGAWAGGDPDCDHVRDARQYADGCSGCGVPMQQETPACGVCAARSRMRRKRGTLPDRNYETPPDDHWERPRARDQVTEAAQVFSDVCGKCGAQRTDQQHGMEATPDLYVANMVAVFREVRRVLAPHGTCFVNLGDSYFGTGRGSSDLADDRGFHTKVTRGGFPLKGVYTHDTLKSKDLVGIPWRVAFALQVDGWWLRSDIIWSKPNPMPESVTDRPTKAHEYVFLLTKQPRYWFDAEAVREPVLEASFNTERVTSGQAKRDALGGMARTTPVGRTCGVHPSGGRNVRSVWEIATQPYAEAHFATFPEELVRRCLLAGCPEWVCRVCGKPRERIVESQRNGGDWNANNRAGGDRRVVGQSASDSIPTDYVAPKTVGWTNCGHNNYRPGVVLDPFLGSGTTALVARKHGRHAVGIELSEDYAALAAKRLQQLSLLA